jgi:hypothetical protein
MQFQSCLNCIVIYPILPVFVFAGPDLPKHTNGAAMVTTPDGTGVVLIGGKDTETDLLELKCSSISCIWSLMEQQLNVERINFVAISVPSSFVVCEN